MELNKKTYLRRHLEQLPTAELKELLQGELQSEEPEGELVRFILQILEERDQQNSEKHFVDGEEAWEAYKMERLVNKPKKKNVRRPAMQIAAVFAIVFTIAFFALPQLARAESWLELITRWTEGFIAIFDSPEEHKEEYEFSTNNPDLQKVHDAVVAMGVVDPVVPMWLDDDYELIELKETMSPRKNKLHAVLSNGENTVTFTVASYSVESSYEIYKEGFQPEKYEYGGITHYISRNDDMQIAVWTRENISCTLSVDCREETFYKILASIYTTEDN